MSATRDHTSFRFFAYCIAGQEQGMWQVAVRDDGLACILSTFLTVLSPTHDRASVDLRNIVGMDRGM